MFQGSRILNICPNCNMVLFLYHLWQNVHFYFLLTIFTLVLMWHVFFLNIINWSSLYGGNYFNRRKPFSVNSVSVRPKCTSSKSHTKWLQILSLRVYIVARRERVGGEGGRRELCARSSVSLCLASCTLLENDFLSL